MAIFEPCIEWVLRLEDRTLKGVTKNLEDGAGQTRFGITSKNHPNLPAEFFTKATAEALVDAKNIYKAEEWAQIQGDNIPDNETAATLLSFAVNDGAVRAVELLQKALYVPADGHMGPKTIDAMVNWNFSTQGCTLAAALRSAQISFYKEVIDNKPSDSRFLSGWIARAQAKYPFLPE